MNKNKNFYARARIFHPALLQKRGIMMNTSLEAHVDWGSVDPYSPAFKGSSALSHQVLQLPRHNQYEISWLEPLSSCSFQILTHRSD